MNKTKLIGFVNDKYAVWYNSTYNCVYCEALNMHMYGILNVATAYEKCKALFTRFVVAE